jgi:hypothetical protein
MSLSVGGLTDADIGCGTNKLYARSVGWGTAHADSDRTGDGSDKERDRPVPASQASVAKKIIVITNTRGLFM